MKYLKIYIFTYLQFIIIFSFLLILNSNNCFAQTNTELGSPFIRNYTSKEYNAGSQNWSIVQDKRGVMYFGNNRGVLEFDGKNWRLIEVSNKSIVLSLAIDRYGTIYVGASGEFGYLASDSIGQMTYISLANKIDKKNKNFSYVRKIHATTHGIYFITIDNIFRWFNDTINIIPIHLSPHFGFVVNDELLVIQSDSGIYLIKNNKSLLLPYSKKIISEYNKNLILPYSEKGKILICTEHNGFYIYNLSVLSINDSIISNKKNEQSSIITKLNTEIDEYINNNGIYSAVKIKNNRYAFATLRGGIIIMDNHGKLVQIINKNRGLQNNSVYNIYVDNCNNLWAALENGISYIELSSPLSMFNELNGFEGYALSNIRYNGKIYASTMRGIYYLPEYKMSLINDKHNFLPVHNTKSYCWDFIQINNTLLAAGNYGVIQISGTVAQELYNIGNIYCFGQSKKFPAIVFLGLSDGFASLKIKYPYKQDNMSASKTLKFIDNGRFKGINETIRKIISDKNGDIWLTTMYNGIIYLKFKNHDISDFQITRFNTTHGLPELSLNYVHYINNNIILATQKGIYKAIITQCPDSIKFVPDSSFGNIFVSDSIATTQIYVDKNNKIWINSDLGIGTLIKNNDNSYNQNTVPFKRIPLNTIYKFDIEQNGLVWISTCEGLYRYDPKIEKNYYVEFHSIIRKVTINNKNIIFNGTYYDDTLVKDNYFISSSLFQPKQLIPELDYNNNSITFEYSTTFFENESANQFQYILEGFDKNWSNWTNETKAVYTNLFEGTYCFKVKSKNIFEVQSSEANYKFTVSPPWYRTILSYIAYGLIFMLIFYAGIILYSRRLKAANLRLENIVKERTIKIVNQKEEIQTQAKELEKLSIVASETDNGVMIMDAEGKIEWVNEGYTKMLGYTLIDLLKEKRDNLLKVSSYKNIKDVFQSIHNSKKPKIYESENTTKSGKKKWVQTTITPFLDNNKEIRKLISIDSNVTKLKNAEKEISNQKEEIIDSIIYAKRIQNALFPSKELLKKTIPQYFILDKPRGIVSGDFYWFSEIKNKFIIAVADCTGHGVPGAFMSMLGVTMLNKIVNEKGIVKPNEILDRLRNNVIISLHQTGEIGEANDGMDIALITIDKKNNFLEYAGANNSAYLFRNNEFTEIFADKMPIGIYSEIETPFSCQKMSLQTNDIIYLFTDGYADQFGGSKDRKFLYKNFKILLKEIHHLPMNEQETKLFKTHRKWKENNEQVDDILIMGIKI
ncbi:MAG: SpoIIE family protein phosphatase [Bacteroidales bacterium]|nr:SpoIIE family protein phosphatase [Bacteroidales bacterium]